ncbi:hypothetical protein BCR33DRAFT_771204 [Rhizoclosmatium globosum]|uniref:Bulb-type lectin domain-containing protein n=1 Tax=Rhizoclosmatium globosum TaxID=329046 RepID=A0A1Y2BF87_9FUNG|nr:hypothetical protein BCR33DRAFT_771204 [Rhizoclosmatium globosum]|eukprot:ORY33210.1 hypothetical protein BCR33DRAFT_771204 [Rhizoclosmatium globosum]
MLHLLIITAASVQAFFTSSNGNFCFNKGDSLHSRVDLGKHFLSPNYCEVFINEPSHCLSGMSYAYSFGKNQYCDGRASLSYDLDGNISLRNPQGTAFWAANVHANWAFCFQTDGNLVGYASESNPVWSIKWIPQDWQTKPWYQC